MTVRVTVSGVGRLAARLDRLADQVEFAVQAAVADGADDLRREARALLNVSGSGAPSSPGEPPRRQSGRLRDSLRVEIAPGRLSAAVGSDLDYGADLEFGTQDTAPRPWLQPAAQNAAPGIKARIKDAVREAIRRAARR
jgi:HK97 gp10 family phage protein